MQEIILIIIGPTTISNHDLLLNAFSRVVNS
jgi:hypothetical protein